MSLPTLRLLCADHEDDIRTILEMSLALDPAIAAEIRAALARAVASAAR